MEPVQQILSRIKDFGDTHGVDFEYELLRYDHKKTGIITPVSLHRWVATLGIQISNRAVQAIIYEYQKGDGVDVFRLIHDLGKSASFVQTMHSKPPQCVNELGEIAKELARRRQTLRNVLEPYDRHHTGHVSINNFYRAFGASPVTRVIANAYGHLGDIDYLKLQDDVKVTSRTIDFRAYEIPPTTGAFEQLATFIKSHNIDARLVFYYQDKLNTGTMQKRQFYAVLSSFGANMSPNALKEVAQSFEEDNGYCNYFLFLQALDDFVPPPPKATTKVFDIPEETARAVDPNVILEDTRRVIEQRRIDIDDHFSCLEREGAGEEVPLARFARVLFGMKIDLSNSDVEALAKQFPGKYGTVRWRDFMEAVRPRVYTQTINCQDVVERLRTYLLGSHFTFAECAARFDREASGSISGPQLMGAFKFLGFNYNTAEFASLRYAFPGATAGSINWQALAREVDPPKGPSVTQEQMALSKAEHEQGNPPPEGVARLLEKIKEGFRLKGTSMFEEFRALDRACKGIVQQEPFLDVLYSLPVKFATSEVRPLMMFYRALGSSDINYVAMCKDLNRMASDRIEEERTRELAERSKVVEPPKEMPQVVHQFLKRFKTFCQQKRLYANDLFVPYDMAHNGTIAVFKVQACFNNVDFPVLKSEIEPVIAFFKSARKAELFNYVAFNQALQDEDIASEEVRASLSSAPISAEIEREAAITCSGIREKLLARHRRIEQAFAGITTPTIPRNEFQARLARMDLVLHAGQIQALIRKYRANLTEQVDWKTFCNDVNQSRTIGFDEE